MTAQTLKLIAKDAEDVQVMSAVLQDAIAPTCEMTYRATEKCFVMIVQRFMWDCLQVREVPANDEQEPCCYDRVNCAIDVEGVQSVQFMGINPNDPSAMLDLLTMAVEGDHLDFIFAGGGKLRLKLADWQVKMRDFGESWPTTHCPRHST